jgi:antitoxin ParD1/3/4
MLKPMNINLSPQLVELIQQQIHSGEFETVDQTIEAALHLLDKRTKYTHWVEETRKEIDVAAAELDAGEGIRGEEAIAQLRDRLHNAKESF